MDILVRISSECLSEDIPRQPDQALTLSVPSWEVLATGGDIRLQTDPETLLNGYGCSPRPRSWAITFASSTASSVSERGYMGAEAALLRAEGAAIRGHGSRDGIKTCLLRCTKAWRVCCGWIPQHASFFVRPAPTLSCWRLPSTIWAVTIMRLFAIS